MPGLVGEDLHADLIAVRDALRPLPVEVPGPSWGSRIAYFILRKEREEPLPLPALTDVTPMSLARNPTKWESLTGVIKTLCYAILISPFGFKTRNLEVLVGQAEQPVVLHQQGQGTCKFCAVYRRKQEASEAAQELNELQRGLNEWMLKARGILTQNYETQSDYTNASRFAWVTGAASALAFYDAMPMLAVAALVASAVTVAFLIYRAVRRWNERTTLPTNETLDRFLAEPSPDDLLLAADEDVEPQFAPAPVQPLGALPAAPAAGAADPRLTERAPIVPPAAPPSAPAPGPAAPAAEIVAPPDCKIDPGTGSILTADDYRNLTLARKTGAAAGLD